MYLPYFLIFLAESISFLIAAIIDQFVSNFTTLADERQSPSSKQAQEHVSKFTSDQASEKGVTANDIVAAKVAAMKAAELGIVLPSSRSVGFLA